MKILSVHKKTNIYAAVGRIFEIWQKILILNIKLNIFAEKQNFKKSAPQQRRYWSSSKVTKFSLRYDKI